MELINQCRCCLLRPPDRDLQEPYKHFDHTEIYSEMLSDCFELHILSTKCEGDIGICDVCVNRLRDACEFKNQVQLCQQELQNKISVKGENSTKVKIEANDHNIDDNDNDDDDYVMRLKQELSELEDLKDEADDVKDDVDDKSLAELLGLEGVRVKRKKKKKRLANGVETKVRRKLKITLDSLTKLNKITPSLVLQTDIRKHQKNIQNIVKYSNCTPFSNKTLYGIVCVYCKKTFQDINELRSHNKDTHANDQFADYKRLDKNNISVKIDVTNLTCTLCDEKFDVIANLKRHLIETHGIKFHPDVYDYVLEFKLDSSEMLNCALCHSTFETFKMLLQHMNGHYRNYACDNCDMGFINRHKLRNHQRTHETGVFKCGFCDKVFSTRVRQMCHEKYTHNTAARYTTTCPHCDDTFTSYYQRNRHMFKEHNSSAASYKCNICDKSFILKSKLTSHVKKVHLMERNHICAECGQGFFIKQSLDEHMIKHNGERIFKCTVCNKAYARKKTLREHMRIHNNDRRFKCGACGVAFVQKCSLKSHMLSNHGITLALFETAKTELGSPN